jgi:hypothetical protein
MPEILLLPYMQRPAILKRPFAARTREVPEGPNDNRPATSVAGAVTDDPRAVGTPETAPCASGGISDVPTGRNRFPHLPRR